MEKRKILSVIIPAYNSEQYLEYCINTVLAGGSRVEIIIVNDGSTDKTAEIADAYALANPSVVKVIHQENAGHGGAVNTGLKHATGKFFKVVDSDDWVNTRVFKSVIDTLENNQDKIDMLISNFVYEKQGAKHKKVMQYRKYLPTNQIFTWEDIKPFPAGKYLLMHSVIYRTEILRKCGVSLPKHTFYVDNIFVYQPLQYVKNMYYLDVNLYGYFIGRQDQSVNEKIMTKRLDQQMRVNLIMAETYLTAAITSEELKRYMLNFLMQITAVSSILAIKSGTKEHLEMKDALWETLRKMDKDVYRKLRHSILGIGVNVPTVAGRKFAVGVYKILQKIYGFN